MLDHGYLFYVVSVALMDKVLLRAANPAALLAGSLIALIILTFIVYAEFSNLKDYAVLVTALAVISGFLFNSGIKLYSETKDRTVHFLLENRRSEDFRKCSRSFGKLMESFHDTVDDNRRKNPAEMKKIMDWENNGITFKESIRVMGNFYEEMATAIKYKQVSEPMLEAFYMGMFVRFYDTAKHFIVFFRAGVPFERPDVYREAEGLYNKWSPRYQKYCNDLKKVDGLSAVLYPTPAQSASATPPNVQVSSTDVR